MIHNSLCECERTYSRDWSGSWYDVILTTTLWNMLRRGSVPCFSRVCCNKFPKIDTSTHPGICGCEACNYKWAVRDGRVERMYGSRGR